MDEAIALFLDSLGDTECQDNACRRLVRKVVRCTHRNALAIELAAARVRIDLQNGRNLTAALRAYLSDYRQSKNRLILNQDFAGAGDHVKAVRTACRVNISSLIKAHDRRSEIFPVELFGFITLLDGAGAQDELFRLASVGLEESCNRLDVIVPRWMRKLLGRGEGNEWDDTAYRASVMVLWRYRLVTPLRELWGGITMHSDMRSQAIMDTASPKYWCWYLVFMAAACSQSEKETDKVHFRQQLSAHLPCNEDLPSMDAASGARGLRWMWSTFGYILCEARKWRAAEDLAMRVIVASSSLLGDEHPDAISAVANLATIYYSQGRWIEAEVLDVKVCEMSLRVLGREHSDTVTAMENLAATYRNLQRSRQEQELRLELLKLKIGVLGLEHPNTLTAMANLAATYWH